MPRTGPNFEIDTVPESLDKLQSFAKLDVQAIELVGASWKHGLLLIILDVGLCTGSTGRPKSARLISG